MTIETPSPPNTTKLLAWVEEVAELTQPAAIHWCDGSAEEYDRALRRSWSTRARSSGSRDAKRPNSYLALLRPGRRRARRGPHVHLLRARGRRRPDEQLARPGRDARDCCSEQVRGLDARPHDVRRAVLMGPLGSPIAEIGVQLTDSAYVAVSMRIMTRMGKARARRARRRRRLRAVPALGRRAAGRGRDVGRGRATRRSTSSTSPRRARSGPTARATAATRCWARSASRCASPR